MTRSSHDISRKLLYLETCSQQERMITTQRFTKRQYSQINKNNDSFNRMCDIFRLRLLHFRAVYNILLVPRDLQTPINIWRNYKSLFINDILLFGVILNLKKVSVNFKERRSYFYFSIFLNNSQNI